MFIHLFRNLFLADYIPNEIKINFKILDKNELANKEPQKILEDLYELNTNELKEPTFVHVSDDYIINNAIIQRYCMRMGLDYDLYCTMIEHSDFYYKQCISLYEKYYIDHINFRKMERRDFSIEPQNIYPWNVGELPFEFLINHVCADEYATHIYTQMFDSYIREVRLSTYLAKQDEPKYLDDLTMKDFVFSTKNNMCYNDEFSIPLFNKKLMFELFKRKYIIKGLESNITQDEIKEESKKLMDTEGKPNYDNESIYESISRYRE